MARRIIKKEDTINSSNIRKLGKAAIIPVTSEGKISKKDSIFYFVINPSSYEETKSSKWVQQETPGSGDPTLQWLGGGPRTVTFEALVTKDMHTEKVKSTEDQLKDLANKYIGSAINSVGAIASKIAGVNIPIGAVTSLLPQKPIDTDLSIREYLAFYRSLLYPEYSKEGRLMQAPPLVYLALNSTFDSYQLEFSDSISKYNTLWVVTDLKINITKQLPTLEPMEALVNFTLVQYVIKNFDRKDIWI